MAKRTLDVMATVDFVRLAGPHLDPLGAETESWLDQLEKRHDAIHGMVEALSTVDPETALEMTAVLWRFWWLRGHMVEGREFLDRACNIEGPHRPEALKGLGTIAFRQGDLEVADRSFRQRLSLVEEGGRPRDIADACADMARIALRRADYAQTRTYADRGYAIAKDIGEDAVRAPLHLRAAAARMESRLDEARALYLESRALNERAGNFGNVAGEDHNLMYVALHAGDRVEAERRYRASSEWIFTHDDAYMRPYALLDAGVLALHDGQVGRSARLVAAAQRVFEETGSIPDPDDAVELRDAVARLKTAMGPAFETSWAAGRKLTPLEAQALALE